MNEYIVTRRDSMADNHGKGRLAALCFGTVSADNARQAKELAHARFNCNECQWFEVENVKYAKPALVNAARRILRD